MVGGRRSSVRSDRGVVSFTDSDPPVPPPSPVASSAAVSGLPPSPST